MTDALDAVLSDWDPPAQTVHETLRAWPAEAFAALLDQPAPATRDGDPLPPLWHWFFFLDHAAQRELGADGHPERGGFLPPIPDRRRMFAGGRLTQHGPLRIGDTVSRRSCLAGVEVKQGRSGALAFVTLRHELSRDGKVLAVEEQDLVYRQDRGSGGSGPGRGEPGSRDVGPWRLSLRTDSVLLFRFSALTFNGHRIHYDRPYATEAEGYPGLVVHGPLLALLMLELPRRHAPDRRVTRFEFRLRQPIFDGDEILVSGQPSGPGSASLEASAGTAEPAVTGSVTMRSPDDEGQVGA
jgi:3-methylfumaryl-CoA hydratase